MARLPGPYPLGPALAPKDLYAPVCCELPAGPKIRTLAALCKVLGGHQTTDCRVCCKSRRACPADACCARTQDAFGLVDLGECEAEDVAPRDSCTCCRFPNTAGCIDPRLPPETCTALGGAACPPGDPR